MASRKELQDEKRNIINAIRNYENARKAIEHTGADIPESAMLQLLTYKARKAELDLILFSARNIEGDEI